MNLITKDFESVFEFCQNYPSTGYGLKTNDPIVAEVKTSLGTLGNALLQLLDRPDWEYRIPRGQGAFPRIPWIVFCPSNSLAPKSGVYVCITFSDDGDGLVAGVITATSEKENWTGQLSKLPQKSGASIDGHKKNTKYSDAFFNPKVFERGQLDSDELINHLKKSLQDLETLEPNHLPTPKLSKDHHFQPLWGSLLTKPFTILTGASGTGKTKLAESLAVHLTNSDQNNSAVIAVGADWTDNRNVLGFVNHLRTDDSGNPTYQTTPVLDLLLRADGDPDTPYFLILDEMNLSHVERYFSDFLSVMEQKDGQFDLHSEGPASDQDFKLPVSGDSKTGVPQKLDYPQNLFVIGTVNIDETTYMFSPKVLDRANVIEFKVGRDDLGAFLEKPGAYPETQPAASGVAESFLELAKKTRTHQLKLLPDSVRDSVSRHLLTLFDLLRNERFEFAYRTAKEITLFLQVSRELAKEPEPWDNEGWQEDLDTQILQKILPKLHGSIGRIAPLICSLSHYCETGQSDKAPGLRELVNSPFNEEEKAKALFPRSAEKLREMAKTLSSEQFVSFIS